ncbi:MAG: hypothetical protein ACI86H_002988, partial [bacterium]
MEPFFQNILKGEEATLQAFIDQFGSYFPLLHQFKETIQDSEWHAEGDVFIHTQMVLEQIYLLFQQHSFSDEDKLSLFLGAVFHDIAKPLATKEHEIRGKIRIGAPNHADRGRSYLALKILNLDLPHIVINQALALVGHHHDPKTLILRDRGEKDYRKLARLADLRLLYFLEIADLKGRICSDSQSQLDYLELFRSYTEDYGLWGNSNPYQQWQTTIETQLNSFSLEVQQFVFANAVLEAENGTIFQVEEAIARSYQYRDSYSHFVIMCGPSGSGKSSWIQQNYPHYHLISLDLLRKELTGKLEDQSKN